MIKKALLFSIITALFSGLSADGSVIEKMYQKLSGFYEKNQGVISVRELSAVSKDPETGKVLKKFSAKIERTDYFYKTPVIKALQYTENGEENSVKNYDTREIEPVYPVFDKKGKDNYTLEILGNENVDGRNCLKIKVVPRKISMRHFTGEIFIDPGKLEIVKMKGSPSKLHWAMKEFSFEYLFAALDGFPVVKSAKVKARVKVALFVSDNITDYEVKALSNRFF
ncbi:MAG TPA: hypothetical protein PK102_01885 [bacterium]|jgi:hypothetical protein|nr:hypothetical protein [bacterium]HPV20363.1 hypothetical protein [bacterium]